MSEFTDLAKQCKQKGITVKLVSPKRIKDFAGMHDKVAKVFGYPKMKPKTIEIDRTLSIKTKVRTLKHEMVERRLMANGKKYWPSHKVALKKER